MGEGRAAAAATGRPLDVARRCAQPCGHDPFLDAPCHATPPRSGAELRLLSGAGGGWAGVLDRPEIMNTFTPELLVRNFLLPRPKSATPPSSSDLTWSG